MSHGSFDAPSLHETSAVDSPSSELAVVEAPSSDLIPSMSQALDLTDVIVGRPIDGSNVDVSSALDLHDSTPAADTAYSALQPEGVPSATRVDMSLGLDSGDYYRNVSPDDEELKKRGVGSALGNAAMSAVESLLFDWGNTTDNGSARPQAAPNMQSVTSVPSALSAKQASPDIISSNTSDALGDHVYTGEVLDAAISTSPREYLGLGAADTGGSLAITSGITDMTLDSSQFGGLSMGDMLSGDGSESSGFGTVMFDRILSDPFDKQ